MRLAAFNVENLFQRARVFNDADSAAHQPVLDAHAELNKLFEKPEYSPQDKARMLALMDLLNLRKSNDGPFVRLQRLRGQLIRRPRNGDPEEIVAQGRNDWVGWVELRHEAVNELAMMHTMRVLVDAAPDVIGLVEVESRPAFLSFQKLLCARLGCDQPFAHVRVIDGNDPRGIDVGLASRSGYPIGQMRSHVDTDDGGVSVFSRDCPVYEVQTPQGGRLLVLPNHLKSKFGNKPRDSDARRLAQATEVARIYRALQASGETMIAIVGDLNDTPRSDPLAPLLRQTDLQDASRHPAFTEFEFPSKPGNRGIGTYGLGNDSDQIDYILLSPGLWDRVTSGGIFRKGAWPGSRPQRWETYPTLTRQVQAASDHHLVWVDLDL